MVAVRRAILERHGNATELVVRVVDVFRVELIKGACSYWLSIGWPRTGMWWQPSWRREGHDSEEVMSWTSEFAEVYWQVAQLVEQLHLIVGTEVPAPRTKQCSLYQQDSCWVARRPQRYVVASSMWGVA